MVNRRRKGTPEYEAWKQTPAYAELQRKVAETKRGKNRDPETIEKIAASKRGKPQSPEHIAKRVAKLKKPCSPEKAAKISAAKRAKPHVYTSEQRAKMSEAQKKFNATQTYEQRVEKRANAIEAFRKAQHEMPTIDTRIELYVAEFLSQAGVKFEHPYVVGVMEADFYIPATNTIVEVQGCYWHGCEKCGFVEGEDFVKQRLKDKRRFGYFAERGYKIRTIWEHEIKKNILDNLMKLIPAD